jgi:hypothetical protein
MNQGFTTCRSPWVSGKIRARVKHVYLHSQNIIYLPYAMWLIGRFITDIKECAV